MGNDASSVLKVAASQIGTVGGKKYWDYLRAVGKVAGGYVSGSATPWCACFVSWVFHEAGAKCAGLPNASCTYGIYAAARKAGKVVPMSQARRGDVILFNFDSVKSDSEHVGIIESVGGGSFVTIEGNTSAQNNSTGNTVARRTRAKSTVFAIVRPDYATSGKDEWIKANDGRWWYRHADGSYTTNGWERINGAWYFFDKDGWMLSSQWVRWKGKWCWLKGSGACAVSECCKVKGGWYAFDASGYMHEELVWLDKSGAMKL